MRHLRKAAFLITFGAYSVAIAQVPVDTPLVVPADQPAVLRIEGGVVQAFTPDGTPAIVAVPPGFYINEAFAVNVENKVQGLIELAARERAEKESYKAQALELAAQPGLSWPLIIGVAVGGLVVGAAATYGVIQITK